MEPDLSGPTKNLPGLPFIELYSFIVSGDRAFETSHRALFLCTFWTIFILLCRTNITGLYRIAL